MSFHNSDEETRKEIEELESLEEDIYEDESSDENYSSEISSTAWELNKRIGLNNNINEMKELVASYADNFGRLYEEDPTYVLDYLERFDGDIDAAIESFEH